MNRPSHKPMIDRKKHIYNIDKTHHDLTSVFPQYETRNCSKSKKHRQNGDNNNIYHNNTIFQVMLLYQNNQKFQQKFLISSIIYRTLLIAQC